MFTSVVGFHRNKHTCGVARFNTELATRLGVPFVGLREQWGASPLLSLKWSELGIKEQVALYDRCEDQRGYAVFWHDEGDRDISDWADRAIWAYRDGFWCPPAPLPPVTMRAAVQLLTFGMAHKCHLAHYAKVKTLVETTTGGKRACLGYALPSDRWTFNLRVSTAIHEGHGVEAALDRFDELAAIVGADNLQAVGCLSDVGLAEELRNAHMVCAFFDGGVRPNNTSVWTAMMAGRPVLTNLGPQSPPELQHGVTVFNIDALEAFPTAWMMRAVGAAGQALASETFSWERFVEKLCASWVSA